MKLQGILGLCAIGLLIGLTHCASPSSTPGDTSSARNEGERVAAAVKKEISSLFSSLEVDLIQRITRPEFEELFPNTRFYLIRFWQEGIIGNDTSKHFSHLVAWHDGRPYYDPKTFNRLLDATGVSITDENYEAVARTFALMTIPDYLTEEVVFTEWGEWEWPEDRPNYYRKVDVDHYLKGWTKLEGLEIIWLFVMKNGRLEEAGVGTTNAMVGDYLESDERGLVAPNKNYYLGGQ